MYRNLCIDKTSWDRGVLNQCWRIMKIIVFLLTVCLMQISAATKAQYLTIKKDRATLRELFTEIQRQTGYSVVYRAEMIDRAQRVSVNLNEVPLATAMEKILEKQPMDFAIDGKEIVLRPKPMKVRVSRMTSTGTEIQEELSLQETIRGRVIDTLGAPLAGASIRLKGHQLQTLTDRNGYFTFPVSGDDVTLIVSFVGFRTKEVRANENITISMEPTQSPLDAVQIIGYGTTTRRLSTGSVSSITSAEIERQPVSNVLATLHGNITGLEVGNTSDLPGSRVTLQVRGKNSLTQGTGPLILIDGVPFSNDIALNFVGSTTFNSTMHMINPGDVERIDVLKDADATSIYGSRGANGVILITTKKGRAGRTRFDLRAHTGVTTPTVRTKYLNTQQYLEMRREAFKNDGITPTLANAPDLLAWDTTRYTDWAREFRQGNAITHSLQGDISGGSESTQFRLGLGYYYETPPYARVAKKIGMDTDYQKAAINFSIQHRSPDGRLNLALRAAHNFDVSNYSDETVSSLAHLPPNAPYPLDADGNFVWSEGGVSYSNPLALLHRRYDGKNKSSMASANISYKILKGLELTITGGYNFSDFASALIQPKAGLNPANNPRSSTTFRGINLSHWQIEPMLQYQTMLGPGKMEVLAGQSWSTKYTERFQARAYDYYSEAFLGTIEGANSVTISEFGKPIGYFYHGMFGRINYSIGDQYFINLTARRDGSSRFGPGKKYANFGAVGLAYIFSEDSWAEKLIPFLSYGKARASYGVTGNDNIGDYNYLDQWYVQPTSRVYDGKSGMVANRLFNPDYTWEKTLKTEAAVDLGFWNDRLLLSANYYISRSGNQLINYNLPAQVGVNTVLRNFEALIQNSGWEWEVTLVPIQRAWNWKIAFNSSANRNKLLRFPGLEATSYASTMAIGEPISRTATYKFLGINPETGVYEFTGTTAKDRNIYFQPSVPRFYGGLTNSITYRGFSLDVFANFSRYQKREFTTIISSAPGTMYNQPVQVLDRWQQPGDVARYQRFTTAGAAAQANTYFNSSDGAYIDASFLRIRNASLSYTFENEWTKRLKLQRLRLYMQGQNLAVFSMYKMGDPENNNVNILSRVFTGGLQISF